MHGLAYLEWCYVRNNVRAIRRSPVRLILWLLYAAWIVFLCIGRSSRAASQAPSAYGVAHGTALGVAGGFLLLTGFAIVLGGVGRFAAFRSPAEAVLMTNAGLRPLTIAIWLQVRKSVGGLRSLGAFSYIFLVLAPVHEGLLGTARAFLATTFVLAIPQTAALPAFLLARGRGRNFVLSIGAVLAACGIVYTIAGFGGRHLFVPLLRVTHVDLAVLVKAPLLAQPAAFAVPLLLLTAFVIVVAWRGNDALPELYAASNLVAARQQRRAARERTMRPARRSVVIGRARVPAGALAIVWKNWLTLRRLPGGIKSRLAGPALWVLLGLGAAALTRHFADDTPLGAFEAVAGLRIVFWTPISAASGLASELAQPLFWLSTDTFRTRLAAWLLAGSWPAALAIGCGAAAAASVLGQALVALCCLPLAALAVAAFKALGVGLYAAFPDPIDAGGPTLILRFAASVAYLVPAGLVATVAALLHAGPIGAIAAFAVTLGAQGWIVLELVALRFSERGASLATLSRAT
jgi:hypothetical protein